MSSLTFDPTTGLRAPDTAEIRQAVAAAWVAAFHRDGEPELDTDSTTPAGQLIDALTAEIEAKNADTLFLANQFNPRVAEGRWQDALGYIYFINRHRNEPTVVTCQLTGLAGTVIPYGALVRDDDGTTLVCNRSVTIGDDGRAETTFRTANTGPIDVPAGSVNTIVTVTPGWDTIANEAAGVVGRDLETRADFEARRSASVAKNGHGTVGSIYGTIYDISGTGGVLDVKVLENIGPFPKIEYGVEVHGHGITVCIYGGQDADIARALYAKKDAGCDTGGNTEYHFTATDANGAAYTYRWLRPTTVNFWVRVVLGNAVTVTEPIREAVKRAVYQEFLGENEHTLSPRVGLASTVYASRFYHAITAVDGVSSLREVTIALSDAPTDADFADVVVINGDQEPVISFDNIAIALEA
ncbi:MAG: baseplate J/gp47 family protein [Planctomycetes bacterium]|nr:baseplate J/gp47 family protein [Planctomycetota bacterium]